MVRRITKIRRNIKAISPVISVLLMIAVAVVASLVVYAWVMGFVGTKPTKLVKQYKFKAFHLRVHTTICIRERG